MRQIRPLLTLLLFLFTYSSFAGTGWIFSQEDFNQGSIAIHQRMPDSPFYFYFCSNPFSFNFEEEQCQILGDINGYNVTDIQNLYTKLKRKETIVQYAGPIMSALVGTAGAMAGIALIPASGFVATLAIATATSTRTLQIYKKVISPKNSNYRVFKEISEIMNTNMTANLMYGIHNQNELLLEDYADTLEIELVKLRRCRLTRRGERCKLSHEQWLQENR